MRRESVMSVYTQQSLCESSPTDIRLFGSRGETAESCRLTAASIGVTSIFAAIIRRGGELIAEELSPEIRTLFDGTGVERLPRGL